MENIQLGIGSENSACFRTLEVSLAHRFGKSSIYLEGHFKLRVTAEPIFLPVMFEVEFYVETG